MIGGGALIATVGTAGFLASLPVQPLATAAALGKIQWDKCKASNCDDQFNEIFSLGL